MMATHHRASKASHPSRAEEGPSQITPHAASADILHDGRGPVAEEEEEEEEESFRERRLKSNLYSPCTRRIVPYLTSPSSSSSSAAPHATTTTTPFKTTEVTRQAHLQKMASPPPSEPAGDTPLEEGRRTRSQSVKAKASEPTTPEQQDPAREERATTPTPMGKGYRTPDRGTSPVGAFASYPASYRKTAYMPTTPRRAPSTLLLGTTPQLNSASLRSTPHHRYPASATKPMASTSASSSPAAFLDVFSTTPKTIKRPVQESDRFISERTGQEEAAYHVNGFQKKQKTVVLSGTTVTETDAAQQEAQGTYTQALLSESGLSQTGRQRVHHFNHCLSPDRNHRRVFSALAGTSVLNAETEQLLLRRRGVTRHISRVPFKVLDAPDLQDDFYLNLVDWSSTNVLAVGLSKCVYLWEANNSRVQKLCDLNERVSNGGTQHFVDGVTSVGWLENGGHLAMGTTRGLVHLYDVRTLKKIRTIPGHTSRVGTIAVAGHILSSGSRDKNILMRDLRCPDSYFNKLQGHRQEVCGLKWSVEGYTGLLASGGNDNKLCIWEGRGGTGGGSGSSADLTLPETQSSNNHLRYKFSDHCAAVKAIAWSPNTPSLLASGGGTADRKIRFWNTTNGTCLNTHDTGSQVCNLSFSKNSGELVSTHGYSQNQVIVWRYPTMQQLAQLTGHTFRVLYLAMSPDGQTIVTGAGDETLRFWNVFSKSHHKDKHGMDHEVHQQIR